MNIAEQATHPSFHDPHTLIFSVVAIGCVGLTLMPIVKRRDRNLERRLFWFGAVGAAISVVIACIPFWEAGYLAVGYLISMVISAYFSSPYIKIAGKIYAFHIDDTQAGETPPLGRDAPNGDAYPDSYSGSVTAPKMWWLMVPATALCSFNIVTALAAGTTKPWIAVAAAVALVVVAAGYGYGDSSWRYGIARGQTVQFLLVGLVTAGTFTVIYLLAYRIAMRWPLRPKISSEYRAHPHLRKPEP
ncbi:hypothetical protein OG976_16600 [Mycobacterium sp. NBC_00419]|uniref:hypothetical protein n=1 Tax=Mycobacterium sp. NBC_00419 TaxID=2975989 RepID=UPI002E1B78D7